MLLGSAVNKTRCSDPWQRREGSRLQSPYIGAEISAKRRSPQFWQLVRPARAEAFSAIQDSQSRRHKNLPGKWGRRALPPIPPSRANVEFSVAIEPNPPQLSWITGCGRYLRN